MKYIKITCLIALLFTASGCKKWLDVNTDPAFPQTAQAEFYLPSIIAQMAICSGQDYAAIQFKYTQMVGAQTSLNAYERHDYSTGDTGGYLWRFVYVNAGLNLEDMLNKSKDLNHHSLVGIAYAIKAWGFQMLTDSHGPVILDEAFADQLTFHYQDQPEVYAKVREWCYLALKELNTPDPDGFEKVVATVDYIYKGDRNKWKKFVYGILAQQYSHLINKPDFATKYADSVIKYTDPTIAFSGAADDALISFSNAKTAEADVFSVAGNYLGGTGTGWIGQPIVNYLTGGVRGTPVASPTSSLDPRLTRMINPMVTTVPATNGVYRGVIPTKGDVATTKTIPSVYGLAAPTLANPLPGKYIFGLGQADTDNPKYPLMSYAQMQFARAEAYFIKGNKQAAYTAYINGIKGHMDFVNLYGLNGKIKAPAITTAEVNTYLASSEVAQDFTTLTIADIMGQKYIAQWGWAGQEQWSDLRKYHYDPTVFTQYHQLEASEFATNAKGRYVYRLRPRFNSEYMWNLKELEKWGATKNDYVYTETWFSLPN